MTDPGGDVAASLSSTASGAPKCSKAQELVTRTIRAPAFSYAHLQALSSDARTVQLDAIQVRQYCSAALKQFLGLAGSSLSLDILKVDGAECWLRVPRDDLGAFAAAITAWAGTYDNDAHVSLRIKGCSDWLGSLVGQDGEETLWNR